VAAYFPRDYARVLQQMQERRVSQGVAAFDVLGFPFEALGMAMARNWGMPEHVVSAIRSAGTQASDDALVITAFAHDLTTAVYRRECDPSGDGVAEVMARYAKRLKLGRDEVAAVLQAALRETRATFASAGVTVDALTLRAQQREALVSLGADADASPWEDAPDASASPGDEGPPGGEVGASEGVDAAGGGRGELPRLRSELRGEVERLAMPGSGEELGRVMLTALEAVLRGGPFRRVVLCMLTTDHRQLKARHGLGDGVEGVLDHFTCDADARTSPIASAVARRTGVSLPLERDFSPTEWRFAQHVAASAFVVVPLVVAGKAIGCLYADRGVGDATLDPETVSHVRAVCEGVQRGITARQADAHAQQAHTHRAHTSAAHTSAVPANAAPANAAPANAAPASAAPASAGPANAAHTPEFKRDAVLRTLAGEAPEQVAASLALGVDVLAQWRRDFLEGALARLAAG